MDFIRFEQFGEGLDELESILTDLNNSSNKIELMNELRNLINEPIDVRDILFGGK